MGSNPSQVDNYLLVLLHSNIIFWNIQLKEILQILMKTTYLFIHTYVILIINFETLAHNICTDKLLLFQEIIALS